MARLQPFLIAPLTKGQQTDVKPWLIPDDAFEKLENAYIFRGRVRKRFGSYLLNRSESSNVRQLYSRLRIDLGDTTVSPTTGTVPGAIFKAGQQFSIGDDIFTVPSLGTPVTLLTTSGSITGTFNTSTGAYSFSGTSVGTPVYFYPAEPVVGLRTRATAALNDDQTIAFDTQFSYRYTSGGWELIGPGTGSSLWSGDETDFFWTTNWRGQQNYETLFWATNFTSSDGIRYYDGSNWTIFSPQYNSTAANVIKTCRIILPFKDRLLFLNTVEHVNSSGANQSFVNRCRFSQNGDPRASNAWRQDIPGRGGYIDAPTKEQIVSAEFLKDRLIVYFERSTWELVYTSNQVLPFVWQKINTELGAKSTFSIVPFDKTVLGIGNVGVHACSGANVERIDDLIPNEVFKISNSNEGVERVYGIRDYYTEMVYWAFPSLESSSLPYPDRILVYNYANQTWSFFDDTITCFGYFQNTSGTTWQQAKRTWAQASVTWSSGTLQNKFRQIIAGNQQGFTFICNPDAPTRNAPSLQISGISGPSSGLVTLTVIDHNIKVGEHIYLEHARGSTELNDTIFQVFSTPTSDTLTISYSGSVTTYTGGGTLARVSRIDIATKQYNFFLKDAYSMALNKVSFLIDRTALGEFSVDYFASSGTQSLQTAGAATGALLDTGVVTTAPYTQVPFEAQQGRLWHQTYPMFHGDNLQMRFYLNDEQMRDTDVSFSNFVLHSFVMYVQPAGTRLQ